MDQMLWHILSDYIQIHPQRKKGNKKYVFWFSIQVAVDSEKVQSRSVNAGFNTETRQPICHQFGHLSPVFTMVRFLLLLKFGLYSLCLCAIHHIQPLS
jgi:hypothetical protein